MNTYVYVCMWGSEVDIGSLLCFISWHRISYWIWSSPICQAKPSSPNVANYSVVRDDRYVLSCSAFKVDPRPLNSGLHACAAGTFPDSPSHPSSFLKKFSLLPQPMEWCPPPPPTHTFRVDLFSRGVFPAWFYPVKLTVKTTHQTRCYFIKSLQRIGQALYSHLVDICWTLNIK